jgi:hypothetical protein
MKTILRSALLPALLVVLAGCDTLASMIPGIYNGPPPATDNLVAEQVIVRRVGGEPGAPQNLVLERVRFTEAGRPHAIDRVILGYTGEMLPVFQELRVAAGDRLVISTRFIQISEGGGPMGVPNWPGSDAAEAMEYPLAAHYITAASRVP